MPSGYTADPAGARLDMGLFDDEGIAMNMAEFQEKLQRDGYVEIMDRSLDSRPANGDHGHEFSVRGLVVAGEFIITRDGAAKSYRAGDIFEVAADTLHNEAVGREGARIVTGRKY